MANPFKIAGLFTAILLLSACGAMGMNKQQYSGISYVMIQTGGACSLEPNGNDDPCRVLMVDGKEKFSVETKVTLADGTTVETKAGEVKAFEGQKIRGDVDKTAIKAVGDVGKAVIDKVP